jgi:hypothetical protein
MKNIIKFVFIGFIGGSLPVCTLSFLAVVFGKPICFFGGNVCFVRPEWLSKLFGG